MADVELHIIVQGVPDAESLGKLVGDAIAMQPKTIVHAIPDGYRCEQCYKGDGGHTVGCDFAPRPTLT